MLRAFDMWTPRFRWTPEHSIQMRIPRFKDAHSGSGAPQSAHFSFPHTLLSTSTGFSFFTPSIRRCKLLDALRWWLVEGIFNEWLCTALWSMSELLNELLPLEEKWSLPPMVMAEISWHVINFSHFKYMVTRIRIIKEELFTLTIAVPWKLNNEAITPVIFSIQSIWSTAFSACDNRSRAIRSFCLLSSTLPILYWISQLKCTRIKICLEKVPAVCMFWQVR